MDNDIIKALGICSSEHLGCEDGCPYVEMPCLSGNALFKDALALINRQKAEIEEFKILCDMQDKNMLEQQAEIKRLQNLESLEKAIYNIAHGIGTNNPCDFATKEARDISYEYAINKLVDIATARKTAIKEFAERLKKHCYFDHKDQRNVVAEVIIDHYVKEMTE